MFYIQTMYIVTLTHQRTWPVPSENGALWLDGGDLSFFLFLHRFFNDHTHSGQQTTFAWIFVWSNIITSYERNLNFEIVYLNWILDWILNSTVDLLVFVLTSCYLVPFQPVHYVFMAHVSHGLPSKLATLTLMSPTLPLWVGSTSLFFD